MNRRGGSSRRGVALIAVALLALGGAVGGVSLQSSPAHAAEFNELFAVSAPKVHFEEGSFGSDPEPISYSITALQDATLSAEGWYGPLEHASFVQEGSGACASMSLSRSSVAMKKGDVCTVTVNLNPDMDLWPHAVLYGAQGWLGADTGKAAGKFSINYTAALQSLGYSQNELSFTATPG